MAEAIGCAVEYLLCPDLLTSEFARELIARELAGIGMFGGFQRSFESIAEKKTDLNPSPSPQIEP